MSKLRACLSGLSQGYEPEADFKASEWDGGEVVYIPGLSYGAVEIVMDGLDLRLDDSYRCVILRLANPARARNMTLPFGYVICLWIAGTSGRV